MTDLEHIRPRIPIYQAELLNSAIPKIVAGNSAELVAHEIQALELLHEKLFMLIMNVNARETYEALKRKADPETS